MNRKRWSLSRPCQVSLIRLLFKDVLPPGYIPLVIGNNGVRWRMRIIATAAGIAETTAGHSSLIVAAMGKLGSRRYWPASFGFVDASFSESRMIGSVRDLLAVLE